MEELQKLYDVLVREGKYTKSFEEFQSKWAQDEAYKNKVYDVVSRDGLYTKDKESFFQKYSAQAPIQETQVPVKKKFALDSSSEVGSSVSQESPKQQAPLPELTQEGFKQAMTKKASVPTDMSGKPIFSPKAEEAIKPIMQKAATKKGSEKRISGSLGKISTNLMNQTEEDVVSQLSQDQTLKDLGFTFEEAGWTGDYMKVTAPDKKTTIEISLDNLLDSKSAKQSLVLQNFIKTNTTKEKRAELDKFVAMEEAEEKTLQSEKKKFGDMFDRQLNVKPKTSESKYLNERLSTINTDLMNQTEENVVAELQYQFGDLDFKFETTGLLGDYMKVTAPNMKTKEVSLDNFLNSKSKREADELKKFIQENTPAKGLFVLENTAKYQDKKFNSEKQVEDVAKVMSDELNGLNAKQKQFLIKKAQFEKQAEDLKGIPQDSEEFKTKYAELESQQLALQDELKILLDAEDTISYKKRKLEKSVGNYTIMRSKQGGAFGGIQDAFAKFPGTMAALYTSLMADITGSFAPIVKEKDGINPLPPLMTNDEATALAIEGAKKMGLNPPKDMSQESINKFKASLTEDQLDEIESYVRDQAKKSIKKEMLPLMREGFLQLAGDPETTKEWSEEKKKGFWGGSLLGTVESIPAIMGGWQQRTVQMYAMISDALAQEMENDPDFKDVTENEKLAVTLPIGIVSAVLENVGLRNLKQSKGLISSITLSVLGKTKSGITAKTFRELVENEVENRIARGLLVVGAAGAAEFETGAAQELSETFGKTVFNKIKEKKLFNTPGATEDWIENIAVAGAQEAVGGFVLGTPSAVSSAFTQKGFLKMDDLTFQTFANMANDEKMQSAYITSLKDKITRGILTTAEAKDQLNNYRNSVGLFRQLPEGLTTQQQKEAMNLLKEKRDLENYINGKDGALVVKQKNRINEINDSLTKLSETDAVQEQITTEIPVQSETGISETVEEGISEPKPEVVTEQGTQEEVVTQTIIEALNEPSSVFVYDGKKGQLTTIGQMVVLETPTEIIDLVDMNELSDSTLADFGIQKEEELNIELNEDNSVIVNGKTYLNNYSNPDAAISQDKDGNYSVTLDTENGQKRTFRGQQADQIVYQMKLKNFEQNGTEQDIDTAIELADEAIRIEEEVRQPSAEREGKSVRKGKRKQRTLRQPKEPLTKAEREAIAPVESEPQAGLGANIAEQVGLPPAPEGFDIVTEKAPVETIAEVAPEAKTETAPVVEGPIEIQESRVESAKSLVQEAKTKAAKKKAMQDLVVEEGRLAEIKASEKVATEVKPTESKVDKEIAQLEKDADYYASKIEDIQDEIKTEKQNTKEEVQRIKDEIAEVKNDKSLNRAEKLDKIEDLKAEMQDIKDDQEGLIENYTFDLKEAKSEYKKTLSKIDRLVAKKRLGTTEVNDDKFDSKVYYQGIPKGSDYMQAILDERGKVLFQGSLEGVEKFKKDNGIPAEKVDMIDFDLTNPESLLSLILKSKGIKAKDLLNLDTKDKGNLQRVYNYLDNIDKALDMDPNELNDVTRVMAVNTAKIIVKTLKTLVNAGITLKEAIEKVAEIHSITSDKIIDALDIMSKINENKSEGISEMELPGFNDLSSEIDSQINEGKSVKEVLDYVQSSETYNNATNVQQDLLVRDVRKRFGLSQKSAPSVGKLFGTIKDVKKITMREKDLLVKQLKDKAKASKDAIVAWRKISKELSEEIKELRRTGKITTTQAANALRAFSKVNVFSQKSVDGFVNYMTKVFENADYADNLKNAKKLRTEIKKLAKNKDRNADLRTLGSEFANIDPALVENIFDYNETAAKIKKAIQGSSKRRGNLNVADTVNIQETSEYVNKTLEEQKKKIEKQKADELQELLGVDVSELNAEEIIAMLGQEEKIDLSKEDEKILRAAIKKAFDIYSSMIKKSLSTGLDVFTDEEVEYTKEQKKLISEFMKMDTDNMNIKESIAAIDSLINFLVNKSTAKMETVVREYVGEQNAIEVEGSRVAKTPLKKLFYKGLAKFLGEQMTSLPILFEKKFKGFNSAGYVMDKMGLTELINKKSLAQRQANTIVNDYVNMFYEKTANNEKFNTVFNSIERDMASFMMRNIVGTEKQMQGEFDIRKGLIQQSIDALSNGNEREQEKGKAYREVYDKILADSNNSNDVISKIDDTNLEAIYWWIDKWNSKFDKLSDVAKNVYNKTLNRELNYTPDKYSRMEYDRTDTDLANDESAFINNTDGVLYKREAGVLMDKKPSSTLPQNKKGNPISYIDLSFDKNNANSMYDALVDIETAPAVRQIQSFMDSKSFEKIFGEDSQIFKNRIKLYIQNSRKKTPFSDDELSKTLKALNKIAAIGASMALAGPTQPFKQVIPVIGNTLVNTGGRLDTFNPFNVKFNKWLDEQGYAISNRGVDAQAQIDSVNKLIDEAAKSPLGKASKFIEKANKKYLDILLAKPDVYIARASWKAYYEQSLRNQGKFEKEMDYSSHKINKEAADYAQRMVDRQQNISDTDLSGKLFSSKETSSQFLVKTMMPFASFRMNQSTRLAADLTTLGYWNSATVEDRKIAIRSLIGFTVEQVIFKGLSAAIGLGTYWVASQFMGAGDDDDDLKKKRNESIKGAATGAVTDIFSPMPITDRLIQWTAAEGLNFAQDMMDLSDEEKLSLYSPKTQGLLEQLGMFGIVGTRALQVAELVQLYATGEYKDNFGNVKTISLENREKMGQLIGPSILTGLGLLPPEVSGLVRNSVKISKKKSPTAEEIKETEDKANSIQEIIDNATSSEEIESAEFMLDRIKNPEKYEAEKEELKNMKKELLIDDETGTVYDNLTDLKRYNPDLYEKNFGKGSEWYELNKPKKEAEKLFKDKKREEKDEEFGYNPKNKRRKNSDGTYKSSSVRRGFSGSSSSSVGYDSDGLKTTKTTRRGFNN